MDCSDPSGYMDMEEGILNDDARKGDSRNVGLDSRLPCAIPIYRRQPNSKGIGRIFCRADHDVARPYNKWELKYS